MEPVGPATRPATFTAHTNKMGATMKVLLAVALCAMLTLPSAVHAQVEPSPSDALAASLDLSGLPIENVVVWTAETDPNHLLGRPGQYIAKLSWHDQRAAAADQTESTIELFATPEALTNRDTYVNAIVRSSSLFGQYVFEDDAHLALLRLPFDLTPDQAAEYQAWLQSL